MNTHFQDYPGGITTIDSLFVRPKLAAIHLLVEQGRAALIDTGTNFSTPQVMATLEAKSIAPEKVTYVIVTHVHLDHAGGAGSMMERFPNAKLVVHPRGARHMIDPSKLVAGACAVYGEEEVKRAYGRIIPVDPSRVIEAPDEFTLDLAGRELRFLDTPGHARHHFCVWDRSTRSLFTGDTFGISYREFDTNGRQFIFPTCTPVQFEPDAAHASIDRLMGLGPARAYLTHYGPVTALDRLADDLHRMLDKFAAVGEAHRHDGEDRHNRIKHEVAQVMKDALAEHGWQGTENQADELLAMDIELNAQGIGIWLDKAPK